MPWNTVSVLIFVFVLKIWHIGPSCFAPWNTVSVLIFVLVFLVYQHIDRLLLVRLVQNKKKNPSPLTPTHTYLRETGWLLQTDPQERTATPKAASDTVYTLNSCLGFRLPARSVAVDRMYRPPNFSQSPSLWWCLPYILKSQCPCTFTIPSSYSCYFWEFLLAVLNFERNGG